MARNRGVFLDRDGVVNEVKLVNGCPHPPDSVEELNIFSEAKSCLMALKRRQFFIFIVTNQPDVARGKTSIDTVELIHQRIIGSLPIDDIASCYHDDSDRCECRKPKPGMITRLAKKYDICLERSYLIGDRWRDIDAGTTAGLRTLFIDYGYNEKQPTYFNCKVACLREAINKIIEMEML